MNKVIDSDVGVAGEGPYFSEGDVEASVYLFIKALLGNPFWNLNPYKIPLLKKVALKGVCIVYMTPA